ncbi:hypothetical protein L3X38_010095 [Prunus dulcis]|uniref:Uncharacterized protein n=1 Tax=Prunus dulcis TaxID=3755 RepID=A0AAD4ZDP8_PRUDU|nr:hypothetical protein L3X38_010095 [Prunus dulcis]
MVKKGNYSGDYSSRSPNGRRCTGYRPGFSPSGDTSPGSRIGNRSWVSVAKRNGAHSSGTVQNDTSKLKELKTQLQELIAKRVSFLGHMISDEDIFVDPQRIEAVVNLASADQCD